ncbi:MAG: sporulation protein YabP [Firmicutes bacterium]|nr:sporulation protein YabP [Bacillota bacterium]
MEEKKKISDQAHQITLNNRNLLAVDGVTNLGSYEEELLILETVAGVLEIKGGHLHVQQLNIDQGRVVIDGEICSLVYTDQELVKKGRSFLSKLIK